MNLVGTLEITYEQLKQHILEELDSALNLARLLDAENQLLTDRDQKIIEELNTVVEQKQKYINQLENNAKIRDQWILENAEKLRSKSSNIRGLNSAKSEKIWDVFLAEYTDLQQLWQKVEQHILVCRRLNLINGRLIGYRKQRARRVEEMLFGKSSTPTTYSAQGKSVHNHTSQNLIRA